MFPILEAAYDVIDEKDDAQNEQYRKKVEAIFVKFGKKMYLAAMSVTKNHHDAEDAVQDTFVSIAKIIDRVPDPDKEAAEIYFCKAARSHALSKLRGEVCSVSIDCVSDDFIQIKDFAENIADDELYENILEFITTMDEKYADVLTMRYLFDMKPGEIARSLNRPVNTVKSQLTRAVSMLNRKFGAKERMPGRAEKKKEGEFS